MSSGQGVLYWTMLCIATISVCCTNNSTSHKPSVVLHASREAPIGWLNLTLFDDSTFVANSLGARGDGEYSGTYLRQYDTVFLYYTSKEPQAFGRQLLINRGRVDFIDISQTLSIDSLTLNFASLMMAKSKH